MRTRDIIFKLRNISGHVKRFGEIFYQDLDYLSLDKMQNSSDQRALDCLLLIQSNNFTNI